MLLMLSPLLLGLGFFLYSLSSALITVNQIKLPENVTEVNMKMDNYEIHEVDGDTNTIKWDLKAAFASADPKERSARVNDPNFIYFKEGKKFFEISAREAFVSQGNKAIEFYGNVDLKTENEEFKVKSGYLKFSESKDFIELGKSFSMVKSDSTRLESMSAKIQKDFSTIHAKDSVSLENNANEPVLI